MKSKWPIYSSNEINKVLKVIKSNKVNYWTGKKVKNLKSNFQVILG